MANQAKIEEIFSNPENVAAFRALQSKEEALAFMNDKGAEMTPDELKEMVCAIRDSLKEGNDEAMDLDALEQVAGGGFFKTLGNFFKGAKDAVVSGVVTAVVAGSELIDEASDLISKVDDLF